MMKPSVETLEETPRKKLSYFKRVKNTYFLLTNLSEPIKKKALVEEYIAMTERVANHNNMPFEHDPDKLYANVTQAIFHLKKKGSLSHPLGLCTRR